MATPPADRHLISVLKRKVIHQIVAKQSWSQRGPPKLQSSENLLEDLWQSIALAGQSCRRANNPTGSSIQLAVVECWPAEGAAVAAVGHPAEVLCFSAAAVEDVADVTAVAAAEAAASAADDPCAAFSPFCFHACERVANCIDDHCSYPDSGL